MITSETQRVADCEPLLLLRWEKPWLPQLGQQPPPGAPVDGIEEVSVLMRDWLAARLTRHAAETNAMPANIKVIVTVAFGEGAWTPDPAPPAASRPAVWMGVDALLLSLRWERPWLPHLGQRPPHTSAEGIEGVRNTMHDWVISRLIRRFEQSARTMPDLAAMTLRVELDPPEWASENLSPVAVHTAADPLLRQQNSSSA